MFSLVAKLACESNFYKNIQIGDIQAFDMDF